ncbi:MAG: Na(+)-translocating NADH-quinone reductase subunit A [Flavobacteriales bacterium]
MAEPIKIRKGLNIKLKGEAEKVLEDAPMPETFAVKPPDFHDVRTKLLVKEGDEVKAGTPVYYDKDNEQVMFTSPVSGELVEVVRGAKRKILEVKILADKEVRHEDFGSGDPKEMSREEVTEKLLKSGAFPFIRKRPFSVIPHPESKPKSIFIPAFDTNPLSPDLDFVYEGQKASFQKGIEVLQKLTDGKVHLGVSSDTSADTFLQAEGVQRSAFEGPHPASNVGVHIHHLDPILPGDEVWYLYPHGVVTIGKLFQEGIFDPSKIVALSGSEVAEPKYYRTRIGASIKSLVNGNVSSEQELRYISGNPLTGDIIDAEGFLGFYHDQVTVLPEGNEKKFFLTDGWLSPGLNKFSMSKAYPSWLFPNKKYRLDTNKNGEKRAYVVTGQYEQVFPFEIFPQQLVKSIIIQDLDQMEQLGIHEVDAEDFALCEFVCTSKQPVQKIVRGGLDQLKQEMS